ncbi:hypothetical protein ABIF65_001888 [Bradyrhizobium japonicum]
MLAFYLPIIIFGAMLERFRSKMCLHPSRSRQASIRLRCSGVRLVTDEPASAQAFEYFFSSKRAIWFLWTSSGPSASRSRRAVA